MSKEDDFLRMCRHFFPFFCYQPRHINVCETRPKELCYGGTKATKGKLQDHLTFELTSAR